MVTQVPLAGPAVAGTGDAPEKVVMSETRWRVRAWPGMEWRGAGQGPGQGWVCQGAWPRWGYSRELLHEAHGLPAIIEWVCVEGEGDIATSKQELDGHGHVVWGSRKGGQGRGQGMLRDRLRTGLCGPQDLWPAQAGLPLCHHTLTCLSPGPCCSGLITVSLQSPVQETGASPHSPQYRR